MKKRKHPRNRGPSVVGKRFGRLVVLEQYYNPEKKRGYCLTTCDCGKEKRASRSDLVTGHVKSCGCYNSELSTKRKTTHGLHDTREYGIWSKMKNRCSNVKDKNYHNYGGRGIKVCARWQNSFENFYADMGPSEKHLSIDRIDNDKGYSKDNCRWATMIQQANNRRPAKQRESYPNKLGFRGVFKTTASFGFAINRKNKRISKQGFKTARDAALAFDKMSRELYGKDAVTNFK